MGIKMTTLKWLISEVRRCIREDLITVYAAQASFYIIIAVVPFAMLLLSVLQFLLPFDAVGIITAVKPFLPHNLHKTAELVVVELFERSGSILSISAITALWTASRGAAAVSRGVKRVYGIKEHPTFIRNVLEAAMNTLLLIALLLLTLVMLVFGTTIADFLAERLVLRQGIISFAQSVRAVVFVVVLTLLFAYIYRMLSGRKVRFIKQLPGAAFSSLGWVLFSLGYEFYIENFSNYSYIYGSLAAIVLMMLWLYFCMIIFLFGAEINIWIKGVNGNE